MRPWVGRRWALTHPRPSRLQDPLGPRKLFTLQARRESLRQDARAQDGPEADVLARLLTEAVAAKREKYGALPTVMARFPSRKTLQGLAPGRFIEPGESVVFLGPPGTGKPHRAMGLGLNAVQQGSRPGFTAALPRMAALTKADAEKRLEARVKPSWLPKLLLIAAVGYRPRDRHGAPLFLQRISRRDERGAMIWTSNQSCGPWAEVFGAPIIATALLERLLHHSYVSTIQGDAYRRQAQQQAGLLQKVSVAENL